MTAQQLKASILQLAIQGKLVPQNPADEPASMLLKRIKAEKDALVMAGKLKKDKHESVIFRGEDGHYLEKKDGKTTDITDEIPFDIPESWEWVRVTSVCNQIVDCPHSTPHYLNDDTGFWGIDTNCMEKTGAISHFRYVNEVTYIQRINRLKPQKGDIVFSREGTIGLTCILPDGNICLGQRVMLFRPSTLLLPYYVRLVLSEKGFIERLLQGYKGIGAKHVNVSDIKDSLIPLPPLEEQARIVAKIEELLPHIEEYGKAETELSKLNAELPEQLKKSILQWAIQGRLAPQDPNDEPASELLKRIKAEKAALIKSGKLKKEKPLPSITEDEIPFDIPESWEWVRLGSLFHISPRNDVEDDVDVGFMPMPLLQEGFRNSHSFEVRKWRQVKNGFTHFMNGDIVIAKITPCFQNRKSAIISNLPNEYGAGTTELHVLRDETHLLCLRYFLWIFKTHAFIESGVKHFTGTAGQQRIGKDFLSNYLVPLPPLAEQQRIVERVETIMSSDSFLFSH